MAYVENGTTILTAIPTAPKNFLKVSSEFEPGQYLLGHNKFTARDVRLHSALHREFGAADEIVLAILSVFLIAFLSELVHAVLLRRRQGRRVSSAGIRASSFVDEIVHMRNLMRYCWGGESRNRAVASVGRTRIVTSLLVIGIATVLFLAEVASVLLTQPSEKASGIHDYNLLAVQPTGTVRGLSRFIRRETGNSVCISPFAMNAKQTRNFLINACFAYGSIERLNLNTDISDEVVIGSWYHRGGSDHEIRFGKGIFNLSIRARIFVGIESGLARRLLFTNLDDDDLSHAKYMQDLTIYAAMEWSCNKNFSVVSCDEFARNKPIQQSVRRNRQIKLWRSLSQDVTEEVTGLETTYKVRINNPYGAINSGISFLAASAVVQEVQGKGNYELIRNSTREDGIAGLIIENGRLAGVVLFAIFVLSVLIVLILIRVWLKPASLADFAVEALPEGEDFVFREDLGTGDFRPEESFDQTASRIGGGFPPGHYHARPFPSEPYPANQFPTTLHAAARFPPEPYHPEPFPEEYTEPSPEEYTEPFPEEYTERGKE